MIEHLRKALLTARLVEADRPLFFNIHSVRTCVVQVFMDDRLGFVAKLGKPGSVEPEYRTTEKVAAALGDLVAAPLLFQPSSVLEIGVWQGVDNVAIDPRQWSPRQTSAVHRGMALYCERGLNGLKVEADALPRAETVRQARARILTALPQLHDHLPERLVDFDLLNRLPQVRQHGDFWYGNLGVRGNSIVIFDWEDFGAVTLHGQDVAVFLASVLNFDPDAVKRLLDKGKPSCLDTIIRDFCQPLGMDRSDFIALFPAFLVAFLDLKLQRDYGGLVIRLVANLLQGLVRR